MVVKAGSCNRYAESNPGLQGYNQSYRNGKLDMQQSKYSECNCRDQGYRLGKVGIIDLEVVLQAGLADIEASEVHPHGK